MTASDPPEVLTIEQAWRTVSPLIGRTKAYELARAGQFPGQLPDLGTGRYRVSRRQLLDWLATASPDSAA